MDEWSRALAHHQRGELAAAEALYRNLMASMPRPGILHNLADVLERTGRGDEAGELISAYLAGTPDNPRLRRTWAGHLRLRREMDEALAVFAALVEEHPDENEYRWGYAMTLLGAGRLREAWPHYESRPERLRALPWASRTGLPEWRGEDLRGKRILIWHEQGLGDQILAARFIPMLEASSVSYGGPLALQRLLEQLGVTYGPVNQPVDPGRFDYWTLPLSLPGYLGISEHNLPTDPYLFSAAKSSTGGVGVVWKGDPKNINDPHRTLPPEMGAELLRLPGAISLDPADTGASDLQATADIIAGLDLVISTDTAVAHLAGAMGRPVWLPLGRHSRSWPFPWSNPSLWHPSVRAFRQETPGDWASVVRDIARELQPVS